MLRSMPPVQRVLTAAPAAAVEPRVVVLGPGHNGATAAALVSSAAGRDRYAAAITDGVLAYLARAS